MTTDIDAARDARLSESLAPFLDCERDGPPGVLLAVSGGPDSIALMHAAAVKAASSPMAVATVDHGLRPESAEEAGAVAALARRLGLSHRTIAWRGQKPRSGIQATARALRYRLLWEHATAIGAGLVLTAHHADDQAETILMRLFAGSGPAGLAGMRKERMLANGVRLARPFLAIPKSDLVAYCEAHGLPYSCDPSNTDERYLRSRLRMLMPRLAAEGLGAARLGRLAERLARDEHALAHASERLATASQLPVAEGARAFDGRMLLEAPEAVVLRLFESALDQISATLDDPAASRLERLERLVLRELLPALTRGERIRATLRGVLVETTREGMLVLAPAPPRRARRRAAEPAEPGSLVAE